MGCLYVYINGLTYWIYNRKVEVEAGKYYPIKSNQFTVGQLPTVVDRQVGLTYNLVQDKQDTLIY